MLGRIDFSLSFLVSILLTIGLIAVYSATSFTGVQSSYFQRQLLFAIFGFILMISTAFIPYRLIQRAAYPFYGFSILLLILVYFVGVKGFGAERWLAIGSVRIQPSELAKLATILAVAKYLSNRDAGVNKLKHFTIVLTFVLIPFVLVVRQPDLGTSLVFAAMLVPLLFWAGLRWFPLFLIISPIFTILSSFNIIILIVWLVIILAILYFSRQKILTIIAVLALHIGVGLTTPQLWNQLKPYQKNRIVTFINPEQDPRGAGYQIIQSQVAIGSGGIWGKGFLNGTQTHLKFLPAQHTDFIFSVIAEEWGFMGVLVILLIFILLLLYLINLASVVRSTFSSITLLGIASVLFFHIFVNIGMTVGVAPVTGLPLPFISYGGSFLLSIMLMIGVVQNISYNKFLI
ncbi:MAG: rod shape-determining protein RodA [Calditrichaeota bacterium]|nr:MAG: rod shape-determining protein RodA [Calditrichota bacterium]MBL1206564.1 rod shape-determining protein RodA [Calditrichota bacterium]NOG46391.1 rod shape-determining protein RodA [Calditrichota bacterium]